MIGIAKATGNFVLFAIGFILTVILGCLMVPLLVARGVVEWGLKIVVGALRMVEELTD